MSKAKSKRASRVLLPKSKSWMGFSFEWYAHKKLFRVVEHGGGFLGWYGPTFAEAKRAVVADSVSELTASVEDACDALDAMRECLDEHQRGLRAKAAKVRHLRRALLEDGVPDH